MPEDKPRIAVIIASLGRPEILTESLTYIHTQTRPADLICLSLSKPEDGPPDRDDPLTETVISTTGLCAQRNTGLQNVKGRADIVVFFDDDFVPSPNYLAALEDFFTACPEAAGVTGKVLADGIKSPGLSFDEAVSIIANCTPAKVGEDAREHRVNLYGCNMAFRCSSIEGLAFDETLPLYGWLEDIDFSVRAGKQGNLIRSDALTGVHLGVKGGRTSGVKLGYSQIANPLYLYRKGTMTFRHSMDNIGRNVISNHVRTLAPEPYVDRWGRVKGNWLAFRDLVAGKIDPQKILLL